MPLRFSGWTLLALTSPITLAVAYDMSPRWAHGAVLISSSSSSSPYLLLHGGKTDPTLSYTYSSAPNSPDVVVLSLANDINTTVATGIPWESLPVNINDSSQPTDTDTIPASAWSVAGVVNETSGTVAIFGGDGGPPLAIQTNNDSTWSIQLDLSSSSSLLNVSLTHLTDIIQPIRKIYSSAAQHDGQVFVTGGEKADGSELGYATTYRLSLKGSTLTYFQLPSLPTDLVHHASIFLTNGTLLVIGGWIPSSNQYLTFSQAYSLDTTSSNDWQRVSLSSSSSHGFPTSRRGHTLTFAESTGTAVLFGGIEGGFQGTPLDDTWELELDTAQWKLTTTSSSAAEGMVVASVPGARWDHSAVAAGYQILVFGGYAIARPADAQLYIYDARLHTWTSFFSSAQMQTTLGKVTSPGGVTSAAVSGSIGLSPVITINSKGNTVTLPGSQTVNAVSSAQFSAKTSAFQTGDNISQHDRSRAIAIGSSLAGLVMIVLIGGLWYTYRKQRKRIFVPVGGWPTPRQHQNRPYKCSGEGCEGLMSGDNFSGWSSSGREEHNLSPMPMDGDDLPSNPESDDPSSRRSRSGVRFNKPGTRPTLSDILSVNITEKRLDMLADEDSTDMVWNAMKGASEPAAARTPSQLDIEARECLLPAAISPAPADNVIGSLSRSFDSARTRPSARSSGVGSHRPRGAFCLDTLQGVCASVDHGSNDSLNRNYDNTVMSFAEGQRSPVVFDAGRQVSSSSGGSIGRADTAASQWQAKLMVAHKHSLDIAQASSYAPVKSGNSLLKRLTNTSLRRLFGKSVKFGSDPQGHLDFRDPSTPPTLLPLEDTPLVPSAWHAAVLGRSVSSLATAHTAESEALWLYGLMDIAQRHRNASATTDDSTGMTHSREVSSVNMRQLSSTGDVVPLSPQQHRGEGATAFRLVPLSVAPLHTLSQRKALGVPDRSVKDIAASIDKRSAMVDHFVTIAVPSALQAAAAVHHEVPPMHSPSRNIRSPQGPRPKTTYQLKAREQLKIANV